MSCRTYFDDEDLYTTVPCSGTVELREASGMRRTLGTGRFARGEWTRHRVPCT